MPSANERADMSSSVLLNRRRGMIKYAATMARDDMSLPLVDGAYCCAPTSLSQRPYIKRGMPRDDCSILLCCEAGGRRQVMLFLAFNVLPHLKGRPLYSIR